MDEFGKKSKPRSENTTAKLAASLPKLAHNSCKKHSPGDKKKTRLVHMDSRTTSMVVEVSNSSSSTTSSSGSIQSSVGSLVKVKNEVAVPSLEEPGFPGVNGNRKMSTEDARQKHKSWHGNGDVSTGVGHGIFTESPPSSQYFPVFRQFSASSADNAVDDRSPSGSFVDDDDKKEMIPMKKLHRQWSFDGGDFLPVVTPRNCHSVGDLA